MQYVDPMNILAHRKELGVHPETQQTKILYYLVPDPEAM